MADYPFQPEQDTVGGDGLPTYEDLAAQKGPNSRFGRWKGWVEKRAAERYLDITPEERARRRERGWGDDMYQDVDSDASLADATPSMHSQPSGTDTQNPIHQPPSYSPSEPETPSILPQGEPLPPSHLKLYNFGSRFLPHTTFPIRALLPLMGDRLLLIGHDAGLSVIDMFPTGDPETSSPADAQVKTIWEGEGVYQLELLEFQDTGDLTPHGVVLALVGSEVESPHSKECDTLRNIRMYNLASLTSLARWCTSQKNAKPLDLRRPSNWSPQQTYSKKHRHNSSITKLKSRISDTQPQPEPQSAYPSTSKQFSSPKRGLSVATLDSSWDMIDDLPLRWATDFVPLASSGSRLLKSDINFFHLKKDTVTGFRGPSMLAVATKQSILLYDTPKGERAFRFIKEFYTPLTPRSLSFVQQKTQETAIIRSLSNVSQRSAQFSDIDSPSRRFSLRPSLDVSRERDRSVSPSPDYGVQMSLFVVFEKKAGLIRIADSAVGEVELFDESPRDLYSPSSSRRSFIKEAKGTWIPPSYEELPVNSPEATQPVYLLTRGKQTHILSCPMITPLSASPPLAILQWQYPPNQICHRVCTPRDDSDFLQVISFGEYGVEVQEVRLSLFMKGKGKARREEPARTIVDVGVDAGFMCRGGQWDKAHRFLQRAESFMSYSTVSTVQPNSRNPDAGFYGWCRKDAHDWRVFWLGGMDKTEIDAAMDL